MHLRRTTNYNELMIFIHHVLFTMRTIHNHNFKTLDANMSRFVQSEFRRQLKVRLEDSGNLPECPELPPMAPETHGAVLEATWPMAVPRKIEKSPTG